VEAGTDNMIRRAGAAVFLGREPQASKPWPAVGLSPRTVPLDDRGPHSGPYVLRRASSVRHLNRRTAALILPGARRHG